MRSAERDLRSTNAQIEFLLRDAIRRRVGGEDVRGEAEGSAIDTVPGTDASD